MKIEKFEDLIAWQEARKLAQIVNSFLKESMKDERDISRQLRRASDSVMSNIAEGFNRFTLKDSKNFFIMARSSLSEIKSHLYFVYDEGRILEEKFSEILAQCDRTGKLITGLIKNSIAQELKNKTQ